MITSHWLQTSGVGGGAAAGVSEPGGLALSPEIDELMGRQVAQHDAPTADAPATSVGFWLTDVKNRWFFTSLKKRLS